MHARAIYTRPFAFLPLCEKSGGLGPSLGPIPEVAIAIYPKIRLAHSYWRQGYNNNICLEMLAILLLAS